MKQTNFYVVKLVSYEIMKTHALAFFLLHLLFLHLF